MVTPTAAKSESLNEIFVRRANKVVLTAPASDRPADPIYLISFVKNLESLGYVASQELIDACAPLNLEQLVAVNEDILKAISRARGAHQLFQPLYPDFPRQVMDMNEARLRFNALLHYLTDGLFRPNTKKQARPPLNEDSKLTVLNLGTQDEFNKIFTRLASSNTSISEQDKADVSWFVERYKDDIVRLLPAVMPNKEVNAFVCARLLEHTNETKKLVPDLCKTATDILRVAVALSGGDVSLAEPTKFRQFKRPERKLLLQTLDARQGITEDMLRWQGRWIRLGERLHPGEFKKRYPNAAQAFDTIRNDLPCETFNVKIESALQTKNIAEILDLVKSRPGDFARKLDHIVRLDGDAAPVVLETFSEVATKVSTPVLLQVRQHFLGRKTHQEIRVFLPKGEVAKAQAIANTLPELPADICDRITAICDKTLSARFAKLPPLGKCYLDPELKNFLVPFSQRSASRSLRTAARGSRLKLPDSDTIRFFLWWKNGRCRTDIDLSAVMFDKDFCFITAVTYYNLKDFGGHHSGDIVDAPHGASEFIDISRKICLERGVRFIVMSVNSYTAQAFCELPECFAGWMGRSKPDSGEVYEPRTVQDKLDLSGKTQISIPAVFDLETGQVIWADMALTKWPYWYNTVAANLWGIQLTLKSMLELNKPNLYDLLKLHIEARGQLVDDENLAETVFSVTAGTPFDLSKIAGEFLQG
ncbi:MAG: TerD family protein [Cyanobacteria bacterium SZAS TMP-1]|nr:TerD family protein [Cyanobacteria bacterium SZAS TMP-1]